jgi:hypothetical protein
MSHAPLWAATPTRSIWSAQIAKSSRNSNYRGCLPSHWSSRNRVPSPLPMRWVIPYLISCFMYRMDLPMLLKSSIGMSGRPQVVCIWIFWLRVGYKKKWTVKFALWLVWARGCKWVENSRSTTPKLKSSNASLHLEARQKVAACHIAKTVAPLSCVYRPDYGIYIGLDSPCM